MHVYTVEISESYYEPFGLYATAETLKQALELVLAAATEYRVEEYDEYFQARVVRVEVGVKIPSTDANDIRITSVSDARSLLRHLGENNG